MSRPMASDFEAKHFAPGRSRFGFCRTRGRRPVLGCSRGCCSCAAWRRLRYGRATIASLSLIVLEEVDALAPARGPLTHDHKVEEIVELLRMVESASESGVLFIATTNRKQALDPALLRRGRFDHAIEVGYPCTCFSSCSAPQAACVPMANALAAKKAQGGAGRP